MSVDLFARCDVVFFDLDDTLIHEEETDRLVAAEIADALVPARDFSPGTLFQALHAAARSLWQQSGQIDYCRRIGTSSIEGLYGDFSGDDPRLEALRRYLRETRYRERAWTMALEALGGDDPSLARGLAEAYAETRRSRHVQFEDALPSLHRLSRSFRLVLITNGAPRVQRGKLEGSGLAEFFEAVIVSGEFGIGKPDPSIFQHALEVTGVEPADVLMVGNSLSADVGGAQASGIRAVWVNRDGTPTPEETRPDLIVTTLEELLPNPVE